jgi:hypothetical protein
MPATRTLLASARRYLEIFAESWQTDRDSVLCSRDLEGVLVEAVLIFQLIDALAQRCRADVFRGLEEPDPKFDEEEKGLYTFWLGLVEEALPRLEARANTFGITEGMDRLRGCRERARTFLAHWRPAGLSMAVGLRVIDWSEEDVDEIYALLKSLPGAPGRPKWTPRSVPVGDPSLLR